MGAGQRQEVLARRDRAVHGGQVPLVGWEATVDADTVFAKAVTSLSLPLLTRRRPSEEKKGLFDIGGELFFMNNDCFSRADPEGVLYILCAKTKATEYSISPWLLGPRTYVLVKVRPGAKLAYKAAGHTFDGRGLEFVTSTASEIDIQAVVDHRRELAPFVGEFCFPLYVALREAGF